LRQCHGHKAATGHPETIEVILLKDKLRRMRSVTLEYSDISHGDIAQQGVFTNNYGNARDTKFAHSFQGINHSGMS